MTFIIPGALSDSSQARRLLQRYFGLGEFAGDAFTGARFDDFSTAEMGAHPNRFTSDDLVAVSLLSVDIPGDAALDLLERRAAIYEQLLVEIGPDRDLADEEGPFAEGSPELRLWSTIRENRDMGRTKTSKLLARKRPRLFPIYDQYVGAVTGTTVEQWEPLRDALRSTLDDGRTLHEVLVALRDEANLPPTISPLRVLDVIAWMEGNPRVGIQR